MLQIKYSDIILDNLLQYKGSIAENYVATQLIANDNALIYGNLEIKLKLISFYIIMME